MRTYPIPEVIGQMALDGRQSESQAERRERWLQDGLVCIESVAYGLTINADDLRRRFPEWAASCPHPNMYGTLFRRAAAEGLISCVGYRESLNPSRRGGVQREWMR